MIEIRQIFGLEQLHSFYNESPEKVHVVLFDDENNHEPDCIANKLEALNNSEDYDILFAIADMTNVDNESFIQERDFYNFPSIEFTKNDKSYYRFQGNMTLDELYDVLNKIEEGYYLPNDEEWGSETEDNEIANTPVEEE